MATTILNPPLADYPVLTSAMYSLKAHTDENKVLVEIIRDPDGEIDNFFSTTLYAFDNVVQFDNIGSLIEERFREKDIVSDMIEIRIDDAYVEFTAIYCEYEIDPDFDHTGCFFCRTGSSVVHRNSAISLSHWGDGSKDYRVQVVGIDSNGDTTSVEKTFSRSKYTNSVSFSVNEILDFALSNTEENTGGYFVKVAYFAISHGYMHKVFYLVDDPFFLTFAFRNMFNAPEYIDVVGTVTRKTKYTSDLAVCSGISRQYDRSVEQTFEVQTGPLTEDQMREIEQLVGSHTVKLCASEHDYDIIITDHTIEADNNDENLLSAKFTFRFAGDRPVLVTDDMGALMPARTHIFSQEFTAEFS